MEVIEKTSCNKIKSTNFTVLIILAAIVSVPIGGTVFAQGEVQLYPFPCPEGHSCHCNAGSGVWVDDTTGFRINAGCTGDNGE